MTKFELVIPTEWGKAFFDLVTERVASNSREWAFAEHVPDEHCNFNHWHVGALLHSNRNVDDIFGWFKGLDHLRSNSVQNIRSHWKTYLCYIMHKTKDAIEKGKSAPVDFGGTANIDVALADYATKGECDTLISDILAGKVLEYQFHANTRLVEEMIKKGWYTKVKQAFESADRNRLNMATSIATERQQCWIFGKAGSGKTELAKWFCRSQGYTDFDIYVTSSGQNPFDDYKGQPCVIVDDIDAETMTPKTALKLADCFTGSAVKARYSNKVIFAKVVVFTSTVSPSTWWKALSQESTDGNVYQLLRRLNLGSWHIEDDKFSIVMYDGQGEAVNQTVAYIPSDVLEKVRSRRTDKALDLLGSVFQITSKDLTSGVTADVNIQIRKEGD